MSSKQKKRRYKYISRLRKAKSVEAVSLDNAAQPYGQHELKKNNFLFLHWQLISSALISLIFFILYLTTTSRSVGTGDSGELVAAAWNLGVPHAPGYPTFTLLSHLAGHLPFGTPAFRMNLLSAVLDAIALGVLFWGSIRFFNVFRTNKDANKLYRFIPIIAALAGIGLLAVSNIFWLYSTTAEVFALNNLFAAITLVLMFEWVRQPEHRRFLLLAGLFAGLGISNQHTFLLLAPAFFTLLIGGILRWRHNVRSVKPTQSRGTSDPGWRLGDIGAAACLFFVGLLPYLYLLIAAQTNPPINFGNPDNITNFLRVLSRADYGSLSFTADVVHGDPGQQLIVMGRYFWHSFTPLGILLAVFGGVWFTQKRKLEGIGLGLAFLFTGPIFALVTNPSLQAALSQGVFERFYILPSIPLAFFIVAGVIFLFEHGVKMADRFNLVRIHRQLIIIGLVVVLIMVGSLAITRFSSIKLSDNRVVEHYGYDLLESLEPNALLITANDHNYCAIAYAQLVLDFRTDVITLHAPLLKGAWYVEQQRQLHSEISIPFDWYDGGEQTFLADLIEANIDQRPVYGTGYVTEDISPRYDVVYWGLTVRYLEKEEGRDLWVLMRPESEYFANLHYPSETYPPTYWESIIAEHYGRLAFLIAYDRQQPEAQADADFVERLYRIAILNAPNLTSSYKDLGLLLWKNGGSTTEIIDLWEYYLELVPDDPQNEGIISILNSLKEQQ